MPDFTFSQSTIDQYNDKLSHAYLCEAASGALIDFMETLDLTDGNTVGTATGINNEARDYERDNNEYHFDSSIPFSDGSADWFWSWWVKPETTSNGTMLSQYNPGNGREFPSIDVSGGNVALFIRGTSGGSGGSSGSGTLNSGVWNHMAVYYDRSAKEAKLFLNGTLQVTATHSGNEQPTLNVTVAGSSSGGSPSGSYDGLFDEIYVWDDIDLSGGTDLQDLVDALRNLGNGTFLLPLIREDFSFGMLSGEPDLETSFSFGMISKAVIAGFSFGMQSSSLVSQGYSFGLQSVIIRFNTYTFGLQSKKINFFPDHLQIFCESIGEKRYIVTVFNDATNAIVDGPNTIIDPTVSLTVSGLAVSTRYRVEINPAEYLESTYNTKAYFELDGAGNLISPVPNGIFALTALAISDARVRLEFQYDSSSQQIAPDTFTAYAGSGSPLAVDYNTPLNTVGYTTSGITKITTHSIIVTGLTDGTDYIFGVRASAASNEESNTNTATATADGSAPDEGGVPVTYFWS